MNLSWDSKPLNASLKDRVLAYSNGQSAEYIFTGVLKAVLLGSLNFQITDCISIVNFGIKHKPYV